MTQAILEEQVVQGKRLGRRPKVDKPALRLGQFLTGTIPSHPGMADHFSKVSDWGLYENDRYGDCGPTAVANSRKLVTKYLFGQEESPSQADVFDLYRRSGNPNFDPNTDADDNGVIMQDMLAEVVKNGIGGTKALGFAKVDLTNLEEVNAAIAIFGFLLYGVNLDTAQQTQTVWDYKPSAQWGGHAILGGRYSAGRHGVISWAEVIDMTDTFIHHQMDEAWVLIWPEHVQTMAFQEGVDLQALAAAYQQITGRTFPVPVSPAPAPTPTPTPAPVPAPPAPTPAPVPNIDPADHELAKALQGWLAKSPLFYKSVQLAAQKWLNTL